MRVPDRFLGYAFCVGDVLLEVDSSFEVLNADGAVKTLLGHDDAAIVGRNFLALMPDMDQRVVSQAAENLTGSNRLGPIKIKLETSAKGHEDFAIFITKLPMKPDRIYLVVSRRYRLGLEDSAADASSPTAVANQREKFYERLENLFEANGDAEDKMLVTVMEAMGGQNLNDEQRGDIERYLESLSVGGNLAARLSDDRFAVVHERGGQQDTGIGAFASQIENATGVVLSAATIDAHAANLSDADSVKALAFSLQQYADGGDGFSIEELRKNPTAILGDTTKRVSRFRSILDQGAFTLVYQPIVDLRTQTVHHFEALSRFDGPDMGSNQFEMITFAEQVGMISEFDLSVIWRVVEKLRDARSHGAIVKMAANVSGRSLSDPKFIEDLKQTLTNSSDLVECLSLEITESAKIADLEQLSEVLALIRGMGFKVYLDDFGAGVSGFNYLRQLRVDALKIDGQYVREAIDNHMDRAFLRSMVSLCRELNITTVAEWVETREHADLVKEIGVDFGQGYYFGKPSTGITAAGSTRARTVA